MLTCPVNTWSPSSLTHPWGHAEKLFHLCLAGFLPTLKGKTKATSKCRWLRRCSSRYNHQLDPSASPRSLSVFTCQRSTRRAHPCPRNYTPSGGQQVGMLQSGVSEASWTKPRFPWKQQCLNKACKARLGPLLSRQEARHLPHTGLQATILHLNMKTERMKSCSYSTSSRPGCTFLESCPFLQSYALRMFLCRLMNNSDDMWR